MADLSAKEMTAAGNAIHFSLNGRAVMATAGQNLIEVAHDAGVTIPSLCYHPDLSCVGSCRLCLVHVRGHEGLVAACMTTPQPDMVVETETPDIIASRRFVLGLLLQNYSDHGDSPDSEFLRWVRQYGVQRPSDFASPRFPRDSDPHPFLRVDLNQCILCTRCIRACDEVQGRFVWRLAERGHDEHLVAGIGTTMLDARCESCGACAAYCPTGAIADRNSLPGSHAHQSVGTHSPDQLVRTTCAYCGVGCQFDLHVREEKIVRITSSADAPVNGLALCVKGRYGFDYIHHADRVTRPRVRQYLLDGKPKPKSLDERGAWVDVDWDTALQIVIARFAAIHRESGPTAFGLLSSAKCTNEENYLFQKFARQILGTANVDHCARLCHSSTVAGLAMCYGSGAMSNSMDDLAEQSQAYFVIGANPTEQHPVFGAMLRQAVRQRGAKLIVADPRRIDLCEFATLHLRHRPGSDIALLNGLMHWVVKQNLHDAPFIAARCEGFDEFQQTLEKYSPEAVADVTGIPPDELKRAAELLAAQRPLAVIWAMGITQHTTGVLNVLSLGNLQMLLGNMGVPGGGVNPLRGQNNVQGACDMGALPNVFPGYQPLADPAANAKFTAAWRCEKAGGSEPWQLANTPGLTVTEIMNGAGMGKIRALFILGEDPALTEPNGNHARRCLADAEFVVVQEILQSETCTFADVILPGASFAEKDGTFTNTERRVQLIRRAITPPGEALADWQLLADLGQRMSSALGFTPVGPYAAWNYSSAAEVLQEVSRVTPSYTGISHERLARGERLQWPVPHATHPGTPILHVGQFTRGKGKFHAIDHLPPRELPDRDFPLLLTTGRLLYHWHGGELTRRVPGLLELCPEAQLEISHEDARQLSLQPGDSLTVTSRRGETTCRALVTDRVPPGVVFSNFHFPGSANINNVTTDALDPTAKIPEYKVCAVRVMLVPSSDW